LEFDKYIRVFANQHERLNQKKKQKSNSKSAFSSPIIDCLQIGLFAAPWMPAWAVR